MPNSPTPWLAQKRSEPDEKLGSPEAVIWGGDGDMIAAFYGNQAYNSDGYDDALVAAAALEMKEALGECHKTLLSLQILTGTKAYQELIVKSGAALRKAKGEA